MRPHKTRRQKRYKKSRKGGFFKYFRKGKGEQVGEQVGNKERDPKFWTSPFSYVYRKLSRKSKKPSDRTVDMPLQDGHEGITIDFNHPNESSSVKSRPKSVTRSKSPGILDRVARFARTFRSGHEYSPEYQITNAHTGDKYTKMSRSSKKPSDKHETITFNFRNESSSIKSRPKSFEQERDRLKQEQEQEEERDRLKHEQEQEEERDRLKQEQERDRLKHEQEQEQERDRLKQEQVSETNKPKSNRKFNLKDAKNKLGHKHFVEEGVV